jgi:predicted esterase
MTWPLKRNNGVMPISFCSLSPRWLLILACTFFAWASPAVADSPFFAQKEADQVVAPGPDAPAGKVLEWRSAEDKPYWYRVPDFKDSAKAASKGEARKPALILMLHGTGMKWGWAFWNYPIVRGKFREHDIVVAPEGMTPGHGDTFNFVQNKNDGEHIAGLIQDFQKAYEIDRVYLYGHSQGAFFCYWFAGEYPELVDGIVAHAGNVLSVNHSKKSREGVAIGILHGLADAVVPVSCAFRTQRIYQKEDYANVKLQAVEGLTPKSGHWPLPHQVGQMFAWLDKVCVDDAKLAVDLLHAELDRDQPDVSVLPLLDRRVGALLKKYKGDDASKLQKSYEKGQKEIAKLVAAHAKKLKPMVKKWKSKTPYGPWVSHFSAVNHVFAEHDEWKTPLKKLQGVAAKHDKDVAKAIDGLGVDNAKAFTNGLKALEKSFLSNRYEELLARMQLRANNPPKGVTAEDLAALTELLETRAEDRKDGLDAFAKINGK